MITSTGSERRVTPPGSEAGLVEGGAPPAASPLDVMVDLFWQGGLGGEVECGVRSEKEKRREKRNSCVDGVGSWFVVSCAVSCVRQCG